MPTLQQQQVIDLHRIADALERIAQCLENNNQ